jgi:hypothetical protein
LNTFIGTAAGYSNSSGNQNIFIGAYAGNENSDSDDNTYVGFDAGQHFKGTGNTFIGSSTAAHGINAIGSANTYVGHSTGYLATVAMNNVFIGSNAGYSADDPWNNTYVGANAGHDALGSNNVFIGHGAGYAAVGDDKLYIDNYSHNGAFPLIYGEFDKPLVQINGKLVFPSDERLKKNIEPLKSSLDKVMHLKGVSYEWKAEAILGKGRDIGLIAQDVEAIIPELVYTDSKGYKSLSYDKIVPVLVEAIKEQQKISDEQHTTIKELKGEIAKLIAEVNKLKSRDMSAQK